ncbi:hypothetical protein FG386_000659 [Cryptosporidium ryanae]|uniref:uncharacterized protein n=1 Tax=Cryptosporidium ryanae TaxID=515981 RepID=UPI00351A5BFA|nr:hypothetical protein FG386_000659 [Cryptosporidium ryanae]
MDKSEFAFRDGTKRPMVKTLPSGGRGSVGLGASGNQGPTTFSRAPIPKFSMGGGGNSGLPGQTVANTGHMFGGVKKNGSSAFTFNNGGMAKVLPKSFNRINSKYSGNNSIVKAKPTGLVLKNEYLFGGSNEDFSNFRKVSTDNQVTSAQPSPRKSLRLQPDDPGSGDKRIPTNDELRLFSIPPVTSAERNKVVPKKFQSRGRDITSTTAAVAGLAATTTTAAVVSKTIPASATVASSYNYAGMTRGGNTGSVNIGDFPNSTKPGDKRTSTAMYKTSTSGQSNSVNIIDGMEVIVPKGESEDAFGIRGGYEHAQMGDNHRKSDNIVADLTSPDEERPRNSILDVFSKIKNQIVSSNSLSSLESRVNGVDNREDHATDSTLGAGVLGVQERRDSFKGKIVKLRTIVESIVNIDPEAGDNNNILLVPQNVNNHRYSESQVVNAFEGNDENEPAASGVVINQGSMGVGRTSVQMVKLSDAQKKAEKGLYEGGNTFKLDEYGLYGHLKWLYGEETDINVAIGPHAKGIEIDAVKTDKSYHVSELDPITQSKTASKIRKWVNPIHGRIFVVLTTSFALVGIFFQSLIYNRLNKWTSTSGNSSSDCGGVYVESFSINSMLGPCSKTLSALGGLVVNELRKGEIIRMFWAMWMHTGFIHIGFNVISQAQLGYMIEPDWGMLRFFLLFFLSGVGGNLAVAVISPCSLTVGSSGGLFGITAASIPYTFENWDNLPTPMFMFIFSLISLVIGMILSFTGVTNPWAHIGGFIVGILYTFATMKACKGCSPEDRLDRYNRMAALPLFRLFMKQDNDWIKRQLEEKKRKKIDKRNSKIAQQWRKNQRIKKNALIKEMKIEKSDCDYNNDGIGLFVDDHGIKRRTDLMILIDRVPVEKVKIVTKLKILLGQRIKSFKEKKLLWTFRILSALLLIIYFIVGWLGSLYPPLYWPNPVGVISFSDGATKCGCCYVNDVYTCGSNPSFIEWCEKKGETAQPQRSIFGFDF